MRIAIFASAFHPSLGGVEELVSQLAGCFNARGHESIVVTNKWPRTLPENETVAGLCVHRYPFRTPNGPPRSRLTYPLTSTWTRRQVRSLLERRRVDMVNVQCVGPNGIYAL